MPDVRTQAKGLVILFHPLMTLRLLGLTLLLSSIFSVMERVDNGLKRNLSAKSSLRKPLNVPLSPFLILVLSLGDSSETRSSLYPILLCYSYPTLVCHFYANILDMSKQSTHIPSFVKGVPVIIIELC